MAGVFTPANVASATVSAIEPRVNDAGVYGGRSDLRADAATHRCGVRNQCTYASLGRGHTVSIADNEQLRNRLRAAGLT